MKSLDEVIENLAFDTRVSFASVLAEVEVDDLADALHYLKEYRGILLGKEISDAFDEAFTEMYNKGEDHEESR